MADEHENLGNDIQPSESASTFPCGELSTLIRDSYRKYDISLVENNLKLAWMSDYSSLKLTVAEFLKLLKLTWKTTLFFIVSFDINGYML